MLPTDLLGQLERCERLEEREERSAEEPRLLSCDNRDCPVIRECPARLDRAWCRVASALLLPDDRGDLLPVALVRLCARNRVHPRLAIGRITREKRRDRPEVVRVVGGQAPDPWKAADVDGDPRRRLACHA